MNTDTDYVHTAVINYEPTYLVLMEVCAAWDGTAHNIADYLYQLRDAVESNYAAMDLDLDDLTDEVDYAAMIKWELSYQ